MGNGRREVATKKGTTNGITRNEIFFLSRTKIIRSVENDAKNIETASEWPNFVEDAIVDPLLLLKS